MWKLLLLLVVLTTVVVGVLAMKKSKVSDNEEPVKSTGNFGVSEKEEETDEEEDFDGEIDTWACLDNVKCLPHSEGSYSSEASCMRECGKPAEVQYISNIPNYYYPTSLYPRTYWGWNRRWLRPIRRRRRHPFIRRRRPRRPRRMRPARAVRPAGMTRPSGIAARPGRRTRV